MSTSNPSGLRNVDKLRHIKTAPRIEIGKSSIEWALPGGMINIVAYGAMNVSKSAVNVPVYAVLIRLEGHARTEWPIMYTDNQDATRILLLQLVKRVESAIAVARRGTERQPPAPSLDPYAPYIGPVHAAIMSLIKMYSMKQDRKSAMLAYYGHNGLMTEISWYRMTMEGLDKEKSNG